MCVRPTSVVAGDRDGSAKVHVGESLLAEPERTLFTGRATVLGTSAGERSIAYGAAAGHVGGHQTVTRTVTSGPSPLGRRGAIVASQERRLAWCLLAWPDPDGVSGTE